MKLSSTSHIIALILLLNSSLALATEVISTDREASVISAAAPVYPYLLRHGGITGNVTVSFTVSAKGAVTKASICDSNNFELNAPALAAIRKWTFTPAMRDGQAVASKVQQTFTFIVGDPIPTGHVVTRIASAGPR